MAVKTGTPRYFIVVGITELVLAMILIICSGIVLNKYVDNSGAAAFAMFLLYYAIPAGLSILAGTRKKGSYVTLSMVFNILAILLSTIGAAVSSVFWQMYRDPDSCSNDLTGTCICFNDHSYHMSCDDGAAARDILAVLTILYILMTLTTFIGSIIGCTKACCDPSSAPSAVTMDTSHSDPTVVTSTVLPYCEALSPQFQDIPHSPKAKTKEEERNPLSPNSYV